MLYYESESKKLNFIKKQKVSESKMISYKDICEKYHKMLVAREFNKIHLAHQITKLLIKLEENFELTNKTWTCDSGKANSYLYLLDLTDRQHPKITNADSLNYTYNGSNPSCVFGIRVILEKSPDSYIKGIVDITLKAAIINNKIIMSVNHENQFIEFDIDNSISNEFDGIINDIKHVLINLFS